MSSKMQLTSYSKVPRWLLIVQMILFSLKMSAVLPTGVQAVYPQQMRDPSNVFKDAVDELFQGVMVALNSSNDIFLP